MVLTSVVGKALEKFYNSKYKDLKDEDREKKVSEHLKALLPTVLTTEDISGSGRTKRGYRMPDVSFGPPMKGVQDLLNNLCLITNCKFLSIFQNLIWLFANIQH